MFCQKCGFQMDDNSKFCPQCATPVAGNFVAANQQAVYNYQAEKNAIRQSETEVVVNAYNHFSQKQAAFDEYDQVIRTISHYRRKNAIPMIVWGCILLAPVLILGLILGFEEIGFLYLAIILMIPGAALLAGGITKLLCVRKKIAALEQRYAQLSVELYNHYLNCPNCPVGPEYINPKALYKIITVLRSGRADTVKESINVIVNDANSARVGQYLHNLQATTNQINAQTRVAAVFAAGSFFLK
ncbi:MAG: zinc ribbon domain-containing protein [Clostridia bacterium]|nr:zinc ribbon domain-containing protein [Clostridia bacterium]